MSDSEQYDEECGGCNCKLTENVHIYCLQRGLKEQTWCSDCVQALWRDLKSDGWIADDTAWSELGFDDGEESEDKKPAPKVSVNFSNAMRMEDEYNAMEEAKEESEADKPDPCEDCGVEAFWIKKFDRWSVVDNLCPNCSLKAEQDD